ncbi:MAG: DNA translocase FtsK [Spirochaetaceae bacterium]|nr:MAG: DNA translocase FtsK [Spirochaetaceae bacterium]
MWQMLSVDAPPAQPVDETEVLTLPAPAAAYAGPGTPTALRRAEEVLWRANGPDETDGDDERTASEVAYERTESVETAEDPETDVATVAYADTDTTYASSRLGIAWPEGRTRVRFDEDDADELVEDTDLGEQHEFVVQYRDGSFRSLYAGEYYADEPELAQESGMKDEFDELEAVEGGDDLEVHLGFFAGDDDAGDDVDDEDTDEFWEGADEPDEEELVGEGALIGVEAFEPDPEPVVKKPVRRKRQKRYHVPVEGLLNEYPDKHYWEIDQKTRDAAETLRITLQEFGIEAEVTGIRRGPVITMFEILPARGVKLTKIVNLADNIALRLAAQTVRIVAPIPGRHAVGIEVPNHDRAIVSFGDLIQEREFTSGDYDIPLAIGKDIPGDAQIIDLTKTPHLLIAGATGSGKSVCVNSIICSILYRQSPSEVKMVLIDPKIVELKFYNDIPHLLTPVITEPKKAFQALQWCLYEMERRYQLLDKLQVRDLKSYNKRIEQRELATEKLPYIVVVVDEFADLMATSGKELEQTLARLAAMSRAVGIHLVLATQRPSTDVITGLIKANIPSRIAFMVSSKVDSRIILDGQGAEKLLGRGDMLLTSAWDPALNRIQGAFLSDEEIERVVQHVRTLGEPDYIDDEIFIEEDDDFVQEELEDPLMEKAMQIVQTSRKASASYLQRRLKIGYNRAARMVEEMERVGIVGPQNGSKPREILMNV